MNAVVARSKFPSQNEQEKKCTKDNCERIQFNTVQIVSIFFKRKNMQNIHPQSIILIEGNLEVKLPTLWTDEKQSMAGAERRERLEERRSEKRKSQKKMQMREKVGKWKVAKNCVFPMI